jgi:hypothetical protein
MARGEKLLPQHAPAWIWVRLLLALAFAGCAPRAGQQAGPHSDAAAAGGIRISLARHGEPPQTVVEASGLSQDELTALADLAEPAREELLRVYVAELADSPAVVGMTTIDEGVVRFTPRYPLAAGTRYRAVLRPGAQNSRDVARPEVSTELATEAAPAQPPATVTHIYPSAARLPENQLKFYLHFSAPMSRGEAYRHIHLVDADGQEVDAAFLELGEELWNHDQTRFTLLCDPGRVKRGLKPREELGPVLIEGRRYALVIDRDWLDAHAQPLAEGARKEFDVLPPDETPIDTATWKLETPQSGTTAALVVRFGEPLDHSLLERVVRVVDDQGQRIEGSVDVTDDETCWRFTPSAPWKAGAYRLTVEKTLEDLAANGIGRPFEVDEFRPVQQSITTETVEVPFEAQ